MSNDAIGKRGYSEGGPQTRALSRWVGGLGVWSGGQRVGSWPAVASVGVWVQEKVSWRAQGRICPSPLGKRRASRHEGVATV